MTRSTSFALLFAIRGAAPGTRSLISCPGFAVLQQNTGTKSNCPRLWSFIQAGNPSWGVTILQQQHKPTLQRHAFRLFKSGHQFWRGSYEVITSKAKYLALTCPKHDVKWSFLSVMICTKTGLRLLDLSKSRLQTLSRPAPTLTRPSKVAKTAKYPATRGPRHQFFWWGDSRGERGYNL